MGESKKGTGIVRVLVDCEIDGVRYQPNQLASIPAELTKGHESSIDDSPEGVRWAEENVSKEVIDHAKEKQRLAAEAERDLQARTPKTRK